MSPTVAVFAFTQARYSVAENVGNAPVAVTVTSGVLDRIVALTVTTADLQAVGESLTLLDKLVHAVFACAWCICKAKYTLRSSYCHL